MSSNFVYIFNIWSGQSLPSIPGSQVSLSSIPGSHKSHSAPPAPVAVPSDCRNYGSVGSPISGQPRRYFRLGMYQPRRCIRPWDMIRAYSGEGYQDIAQDSAVRDVCLCVCKGSRPNQSKYGGIRLSVNLDVLF